MNNAKMSRMPGARFVAFLLLLAGMFLGAANLAHAAPEVTQAMAAPGLPAVTLTTDGDHTQYSLTLQILALMTVLTLLPASQFGYTGNHFRLGYGRRDMQAGLDRLEEFIADGGAALG